MKGLFIGFETAMAEQVQLAVRFRWPDATVSVANNPDVGLELVEREAPDVVILQSNTKGKPSSQVIRDLRSFSDVPLIVLGSSDGGDEMDDVKALDAGADDFIRDGDGLLALAARLVALMRRVWRLSISSDDRPISNGSLLLDPATYEVFIGTNRISLTSTEFRLLHLLLKRTGTVAGHRLLEMSLWGDRVDSSALVKKYVHRLRQKLAHQAPDGHRWIVSVHGVGYRFVGAPNAGVGERLEPAAFMAVSSALERSKREDRVRTSEVLSELS